MARGGPKARTTKNSRPKARCTVLWEGFKPPEDFSPGALAEFERLVACLSKLGLLERTDPRLVCLAAHHSALIDQARESLGKADLTQVAANGTLMPHPMLGSIVMLSARLRGLLNDMGLTPKTNRPVHVASGPEAAAEVPTDWEGILNVAG